MYYYNLSCWDFEEDSIKIILTCDKQYTRNQFYDLVIDLMVNHYNPDECMDTTDSLLKAAIKDLVDLFGFKYLSFETIFAIQWEYIPDELNESEANLTPFCKAFKEKLNKLQTNEEN